MSFTCNVCGDGFDSSSGLRIHKSTEHPEEYKKDNQTRGRGMTENLLENYRN